MAGKKRQCTKGKSCGRTCISRVRVCRVDAEEGLSKGLSKVSKGLGDRSRVDGSNGDKFLRHMRANSFEVPVRSFNGEDVAKMLNKAVNDLDGEAKVNLDKLRQFAMKDGQALFVSMPYNDYLKKHGDKAAERATKWSMSSEYIRLLDRSTPSAYTFAKKKADLEERIDKGTAFVKSLRERIAEREAKGYDTSLDKSTLKKLSSSLREDKKLLRELPMDLARRTMSLDDVGGWTQKFSRYVVINETSLSFSYDRSREIDPKSIQSSIASVIAQRMGATNSTNIDALTLSTHDFTSAYSRPNSTISARRNEQILMTYVHEMGHQVHFRAGSPNPPADSVSLGRRVAKGITEYSTTNHFETFAEAFVAYTFNPKALRQADEPLYNWVRDSVDSAMAKAGAMDVL